MPVNSWVTIGVFTGGLLLTYLSWGADIADRVTRNETEIKYVKEIVTEIKHLNAENFKTVALKLDRINELLIQRARQ